jgi:hypothetical protein
VRAAVRRDAQHMPRPARWSRDFVLAASAQQHGLLTAAQLADLGVTRSSVSRSDRLGGMFSRVLPGVHRVDGRGPLSVDQRDRAALLYAGPDSVLTGAEVLRRRRVGSAAHPALRFQDRIHVLVPHETHRASHGFVTVERTRYLPHHWERDGLRFAALPRVVLDAVRRCTDEDAVRALIFDVVQRRLVTPESLEDERRLGQIRGSRFARLALEEVFAGIRSVPEGDVRRTFVARGWTDLLFNPRLHLRDGTFLAMPDVYHRSGVCLEVDSREHHFAVETWESTMRRHASMTAAGLAVIHTPPSRFRREPEAVLDEFARAVDVRQGWPAPSVVVRDDA